MPLTVVPLSSDLTSFQVFISLQDEEELSFSVHDVPPPNGKENVSLANAKIECSSAMRLLFQGFEEVLWNRLQQSTNIDAFCVEVKDVLECIFHAKPKSALPRSEFCTRVLSQIEEIGWEAFSFVSDDFTKLNLRILDKENREHTLRMELPPEYPDTELSVSADFPSFWSLHWTSHSCLGDAFSQFQQVVESFQDFWNVMEDIDKRAWVVEPDRPSRVDTFRRVALGGHCSLSFTVNPLTPRSLPDRCRFFGPETVVSPLRKKLSDNITKWMLDKLLVDNLEAVLELQLPQPQAPAQEDLTAECGICYAYTIPEGQDGTNVPDRVCDNASCGRPFHTICLVDWLRSLTTTRQSFNVLFGNCPYCSHPLAVKSLTF